MTEESTHSFIIDAASNLGAVPDGRIYYAEDEDRFYARKNSAWRPVSGYALPVQAASVTTFIDSQVLYFGGAAGLAPTTTAGTSLIYIPASGVITAAYVFGYFVTAGTNENWTLAILKNGTTSTTIQTLGASTNLRTWSNTSLSITVARGDYVEIKATNPAWATNPVIGSFGGTIFIS